MVHPVFNILSTFTTKWQRLNELKNYSASPFQAWPLQDSCSRWPNRWTHKTDSFSYYAYWRQQDLASKIHSIIIISRMMLGRQIDDALGTSHKQHIIRCDASFFPVQNLVWPFTLEDATTTYPRCRLLERWYLRREESQSQRLFLYRTTDRERCSPLFLIDQIKFICQVGTFLRFRTSFVEGRSHIHCEKVRKHWWQVHEKLAVVPPFFDTLYTHFLL